MTAAILLALAIAAVTALGQALAARLGWPSPVLLVAGGLLLALAPGLPRVELDPELLLLVFLPPIIYQTAFASSWRSFRANLRPIALLAIGCVVFTTAGVAWAAHTLFALPWGLAFLLGAIVSPPDVVAPLAIVRRLGVPKRLADVLEGEGLVNDATALILIGVALEATVAGRFEPGRALGLFGAVLVGETLWGIAVGALLLRLRTLAREPRIEITLSLMTPFIAFIPPHMVGGSGVLATVVAGLWVGTRGVDAISAATRLQAVFFWDFAVALVTGAIFLLTGLQARVAVEALTHTGLADAVWQGVVVSLVAIAARFVWVFPATYLPRRLPSVRRTDPDPPWQLPFAIAFVGVRGAVSLAAALSLPRTLGEGRSLVLFVTFVVILVTLVVQGPTLGWVMRRLRLTEAGAAERGAQAGMQAEARVGMMREALNQLDNVARRHRLTPAAAKRLRDYQSAILAHLEHRDGDPNAPDVNEGAALALVGVERRWLNAAAARGQVSDEVRRMLERDLDLREAQLAHDTRGVDGE